MRFLRLVEGYRRTDIKEKIKMFNLKENIKEYKLNYIQCTLRMATNEIPWKLFECRPKGRTKRGRQPEEWKD
jgi:hypothetical protein